MIKMLFAGIFWGTRMHFETDAGDELLYYIKSKGHLNYIFAGRLLALLIL